MRYIFAFGDSLTRGVGESPLHGWTGRLRKYVETQDEAYRFYNQGIDAETSVSLAKRLETEFSTRAGLLSENDSCLILLQTGLFDTLIKDNYPVTSMDDFRNTVRSIIQRSKKLADDVVVLGLLPIDEDELQNNHNILFSNEIVADYNDILAAVSKEEDVLFIDFFTSWSNINYELFLIDGLHPTDEGYDIIFERLLDMLLKQGLITEKQNSLNNIENLF